MERVTVAVNVWRDAQVQALEAEEELSTALRIELAGGPRVPKELVAKVKHLRAIADEHFTVALSLIDSYGGVKR